MPPPSAAAIGTPLTSAGHFRILDVPVAERFTADDLLGPVSTLHHKLAAPSSGNKRTLHATVSARNDGA